MSSTAWTFGKSAQRASMSKTGIPGPGNYQSSYGSKSPAFTISKGKASTAAKYVVPGPGQYHAQGSIDLKNGRTMGAKSSRNSFMSAGLNTPGPGAYSHEDTKVRPSTAGGKIGVRTKSCIESRPATSSNVGPGRYSFSSERKVTGKQNVGFGAVGHGDISKQRDKVPGPGNYNTTSSSTAGVRFGSSKRNFSRNDNGVGPGQYNSIDHSKIGNNSITIKSRHGSTMGSRSNVPGPGQYTIAEKRSGGLAFGSSQRSNLSPRNKTPGPGHVTIKGSLKEPTGGSTWGNCEGADRSKAMMGSAWVPGPG